MKNESGVTLIFLVVTIIVALILTQVTLRWVVGPTGIIGRARDGKDDANASVELEKVELAVTAAEYAGGGKLTTANLDAALQKNFRNSEITTEFGNYWYYEGKRGYRIDKDGNIECDNMLPDEYQQVEYLESTGLQYIDARIVPVRYPNMVITVKGNYTQVVESNQDEFVMGVEQNGGPYILLGQSKKYGNNGFVGQMTDGGGERHMGSIDTYNHTFMLDLKECRAQLDLTPTELESKNIEGITGNYYLFAQNKMGYPAYSHAHFRMNYCKMTQEGKKIRYFLPCYTKEIVTDVNGVEQAVGTTGLYELMEGKFYTNKGAGTFLRGPDV